MHNSFPPDDDTVPQMGRVSMDSSVFSLQLSAVEQVEEGVEEGFHDIYRLGKKLGEGGFGRVYRCHLRDDMRQSYAVKVLSMAKYDPDEIGLLDSLVECPNVTGVVDLFLHHDDDEAYIVMEEMKGGDLLDRLRQEGGPYTEDSAKPLFKTLLETVRFCHSRGIAHLDIKPENVLLSSNDDKASMQLADFGLAKRFVGEDGKRIPLVEKAGTHEYMAPEIIMLGESGEREYDERCDIWSCGVLLFILLGGYHPFDTEDMDELRVQVCSGIVEYDKRYWKNISAEAKELISRMLTVDPDERCSLEEALSSDWFSC